MMNLRKESKQYDKLNSKNGAALEMWADLRMQSTVSLSTFPLPERGTDRSGGRAL